MPYPLAMTTSAPLEVQRRPRAALAAGVATAAAVLGLAFWFVNTPPGLASVPAVVTGSTPTGQALYLGVVRADPSRTLHLTGLRVRVVSDAPVTVEPLLCVDGSPAVTSEPDAFCAELVDPEGRTFDRGDTIVLRVLGETPGTVSVDRLRVGFRDGLRWGTRTAGAPARITVLGR